MKFIYSLFFILFAFSSPVKSINSVRQESIVVNKSLFSYGKGIVNLTSSLNEEFSYQQTPEWKKHKQLRAWGWTALTLGGVMMTVGSFAHIIDNWEGPEHHNRFLILACSGATITAASIPLFVYSYKNKKRALAFGTTSQMICMPVHAGQTQQPGLSFCFCF